MPKTTLSKALPLGTDIDGVNGTWEFYTRLSLTDNTKIKYTKVWDDWSDEDLDGLTVNKATVNVTLQRTWLSMPRTWNLCCWDAKANSADRPPSQAMRHKTSPSTSQANP